MKVAAVDNDRKIERVVVAVEGFDSVENTVKGWFARGERASEVVGFAPAIKRNGGVDGEAFESVDLSGRHESAISDDGSFEVEVVMVS